MVDDVFEDPFEGTQTEGDLKKISDMVGELWVAMDEEARLEQELAAAKEHRVRIQEERLPELFTEAGLVEFVTANGLKVTIRTKLYGSLRNADENAVQYLKEMGGEEILRLVVDAKFPAGMIEKAREAFSKLESLGYEPGFAQNCHPGTLQKWARERLEEGTVLDIRRLGLYERTFAEVKEGSKK